MNGLIQRFSTSGLGRFWAKFMADFSTYGAVLIAWQSLFSLFPLIVGFLAIFSLVLQDPSQRRALAENVAQQFPSQVTDLLGFMEETRQLGGVLGLISAAGLIWSGFWLFDTMAFVFNRFYRVPDRSYLAETVMALTMMAVYVVLISVSVLAAGISTFLVGLTDRVLPFDIPGFAPIVGWLVSLASAILMFLAVYRFVPNASLTISEVWRGAAVAAVLFMLLNQVFPLYLRLFGGGFAAYKTLGLFLILMTWFYFLGIILVLGAAINAFLAAETSSATDDRAERSSGPQPWPG